MGFTNSVLLRGFSLVAPFCAFIWSLSLFRATTVMGFVLYFIEQTFVWFFFPQVWILLATFYRHSPYSGRQVHLHVYLCLSVVLSTIDSLKRNHIFNSYFSGHPVFLVYCPYTSDFYPIWTLPKLHQPILAFPTLVLSLSPAEWPISGTLHEKQPYQWSLRPGPIIMKIAFHLSS